MRRGVIGIFLVFVFMSAILIFLFGVAVPVLMDFNVNMYSAGERILEHTDLTAIQNDTARAHINATFEAALGATQENIDILSYFYQYSWLVILIVVLLVIFMRSRLMVETDIK